MNGRNRILRFALVALLCGLFAQTAAAQVRAGLGYLRLSPGARQVGVAGAQAGALDFTDSFYANPAATGLLREWQWSASYTNWISDVYNASFLFGGQYRTPLSRWSKFVVGLNYFGVPEFDSSDGATTPVSGNNMLALLSYGQPIGGANLFAIGGNVKYFRSELADFEASAVAFDLGLMARTHQLRLLGDGDGFLDEAVLSTGVSVTNLGKDVTFIDEATPLPRALRAGAAINLGSHEGLQLSLSGDYTKMRHQDGFFNFGSEISWRQLLTLRLGYTREDLVLGRFSFGASLRLDDHFSALRQTLPGRNNALRFDFAANQSSALVSSPFHGTASHFPIGPEGFRITTAPTDMAGVDTVKLAWEKTFDRDLFDHLSYWLLVGTDSLAFVEMMEIADRGGYELFHFLLNDAKFDYSEQIQTTSKEFHDLPAGDYFWTVFAYDLDQHVRFADFKDGHLGRFRVAPSRLLITGLEFEYHPWITTDDLQGRIKVTVTNPDQRPARNYSLALLDSSEVLLSDKTTEAAFDPTATFAEQEIPEMAPGTTMDFEFEWRTQLPGRHRIIAEVHETHTNGGTPIALVDYRSDDFFTIPKGTFATEDTVIAQTITNVNYELPYVGKVFFDSLSSVVEPRFIRNWVIEPLLVTLSNRLNENPGITISLQGAIDPNSDENDIALANARAQAVRDTLVALGTNSDQITLLPGVALPRRNAPRDPLDFRWILQERRRVDITATEANERVLFRPVQANYNENEMLPVDFIANITGAVPITNGFVTIRGEGVSDSLALQEHLSDSAFCSDLIWHPDRAGAENVASWLDAAGVYAVNLTDSLGRQFYTHEQTTYLKTQNVNRERMYFGVAKYALAEPLYNFYWDNLTEHLPRLLEKPNARLRFVGHACAIGAEEINKNLSIRRARLFYDRFLAEVKRKFPELHPAIKQRLDPPEGHGEEVPFTFRGANGAEILLGDNNLPTGRQLNRRVMAVIYSVD